MHNRNAIGIDVGGSSLKCGLINSDGQIKFSLQHSLAQITTQAELVDRIEEAIRHCKNHSNCEVLGVGIGFPGIIERGVVIGGGINLPGVANLPLGDLLSDRVRLPVIIDNDANMMALGEIAYGSARNYQDVIFITVGTGIGGAILVNKTIVGGYKSRGGELGHIIIQKDGKPCACGAKGCFEAYASTKALIDFYKEKAVENRIITGEQIVERYLNREIMALDAMNNHFDCMATGIASLVNVFSPQCVIIGGGISEAGEFYVKEIASRVRKTAIPVAQTFMDLRAAALGNKAGLLGCAFEVFKVSN